MKLALASLALLMPASLPAQTPAPPPAQLSPQAAFDLASRPLNLTRNAVANWSDTELAALAVSMKRAATECSARPPGTFSGEDLIALARLCSFGQQWPAVAQAALRYIDSNDPAKPQLGLAYSFNLAAKIQLRDAVDIVTAAETLLNVVPYDDVADSTVNDALRFLQLAYTADALRILALRQQLLLKALASPKPLLPRAVLYADALAMPALMQYASPANSASLTVAQIDQALGDPALPPPDEALPIAEARRRYNLLGQPLPKLDLERSLLDPPAESRINPDRGTATALLIFPDWCPQCIRLAQQIPATLPHLALSDVRLYALLAAPLPARESLLPKPSPARPKAATAKISPADETTQPQPQKTAAQLLLHTPTFIVPPATLTTLALADFPTLLVVDHAGIVRFIGIAPETAFQPNDYLDQIAERVGRQWPAKNPQVPPHNKQERRPDRYHPP